MQHFSEQLDLRRTKSQPVLLFSHGSTRAASHRTRWRMIVSLGQPLSIVSGDRQWEIGIGQAMLLPPQGGEFAIETDGETLVVDDCCSEGSASFGGEAPLVVSSPTIRSVAMMARDSLLEDANGHTVEVDEAYAKILFSEARRSTVPTSMVTSGPPPAIEKACNFVANNLEHSLHLETVAEAVGVTSYHLAGAFREHLGMSLRDYVRESRLIAAKRLVFESSASLAEVAYRTGFASQSYMTTAFKSSFGKTPGAMRKQRQFVPPRPKVRIDEFGDRDLVAAS